MLDLPRPGSGMGIMLSGGLDSAILLGHLAKLGYRVYPIHVRWDVCWQWDEEAAAIRFIHAINSQFVEPLVTLELPVADLYGPHWSVTGLDVPDGESPDEAVFLPGRNALLLVKASIWCQLHGVKTLVLGSLANNPFPDAKPRFVGSFETAMSSSGCGPIEILCPLLESSKTDVMRLGERLPLELTFSCINPVDGQHCGDCNKCAERQKAFASVGRKDLTHYARPTNLSLKMI